MAGQAREIVKELHDTTRNILRDSCVKSSGEKVTLRELR